VAPVLDTAFDARLYVEVADNQGNVTRVARTFSVLAGLVNKLFFPFLKR
jgi:hypothetical protein